MPHSCQSHQDRWALYVLVALLTFVSWLAVQPLDDSVASASSGTAEASAAPVARAKGARLPKRAPWVRTADGWERAIWQIPRPRPATPPPHPVLLATLMLLASTGFLLAFPATAATGGTKP